MKVAIIAGFFIVAVVVDATRIDPDQIERWFRRMDRNGNGKITLAELDAYEKVYKKECKFVKNPQKQTFQMADGNYDGRMGFQEFVRVIGSFATDTPRPEARGYFNHMDTDGDGFLDKREWREGINDARHHCVMFKYLAHAQRALDLDCVAKNQGILDLNALAACFEELGANKCRKQKPRNIIRPIVACAQPVVPFVTYFR